MQDVPSLVGSDSDLDALASSAPRAPIALRALAFDLFATLGSASVAGWLFGASDLARACSAAGGWVGVSTAGALFGLWLWFGQLLGVALWLVHRSGSWVKRRLPSEVLWHASLALLAGAFTLLLAHKLLEGGGIRRTAVASFAPWVLPVGVGLLAWFTLWTAASLLAGGSARTARWLIVSATGLLALGAAVLDARLPGGYLYLHVLVLTLAVALCAQWVELLRVPQWLKYLTAAASLITLPTLLAFPASRFARELLAQPKWAGWQLVDYAKFHVDFDHDGHSPAFGGDDCDDGNASIFVGAPEQPGDGVDSDCDGLDAPKTSTRVYAPFRVSDDAPARRIAERAKQYPTVVILVDALRFDRIGDARFPNLSRLASESVWFTHAYSTSATTLTSVPAMMTGRVRPARGRENIAGSLARMGQTSRFIAPDVVTEHFEKLQQSDPLLSFSAHDSIPTDRASGWGLVDTAPTSAQLTSRAVELLDSASPPQLLWLHYFDTHQWNALEEPGLPEKGQFERYDAVLRRLDASLGPLLERRDALTLVLIADHGEALGARGLEYHANFVFQELARIPLLIRVPRTEPATVDVPVSSTGVYNTLRALRGLESDPTADASLLPLVGATALGDGPGFAGFDSGQWSFLHGNHRLLYMPHQQVVELYDVAQDPLERTNQADVNPILAGELLSRLFQLNNEAPQ